MSDPFTDSGGWSRCIIGGSPTPGLCTIKGAPETGWEVKSGKGADGGICTYNGRPPAKDITATFRAWEPEHFAEWDAIMPLLRPQPTKGVPVTALVFYHPALAKVGIGAVVVTKVSLWEEQEPGEWTFEVTLAEYRPAPPVSAVKTPDQAGGLPDASGSTPDPRVVAIRNENAELMKRGAGAFAELFK